MQKLDCSFLLGILVVVFAWLNPADHWTRLGLVIVGLVIVVHSFSPCFCKKNVCEPKVVVRPVAAPKKKVVKKKTNKKKTTKRK